MSGLEPRTSIARRPRRLSILGPLVAGATALAGLLAAPSPAAAQNARFALVIQGASGEEQYATLHREWVDSLSRVLRDRFKYDAGHLMVLTETPSTGETRSTADNAAAAVSRLAKVMTPTDQLVIVFIGHGSGDGADAKFNLIGRDLTIAEWKKMLDAVPGRLAIVDTTSGSFPYLKGLAAPGRIVITATNTFSQKFHTTFPKGFIDALSGDVADLDKNGRVSLLEAFTHASRVVKDYYEQKGTMATEVAALDDNGDGAGRIAGAEGPDGSQAALMYLDAPAVATSADPETQKLLVRQRDLTERVDDLRRRQSTMPAAEFDRQFEALLAELAEVSREVRRRSGN